MAKPAVCSNVPPRYVMLRITFCSTREWLNTSSKCTCACMFVCMCVRWYVILCITCRSRHEQLGTSDKCTFVRACVCMRVWCYLVVGITFCRTRECLNSRMCVGTHMVCNRRHALQHTWNTSSKCNECMYTQVHTTLHMYHRTQMDESHTHTQTHTHRHTHNKDYAPPVAIWRLHGSKVAPKYWQLSWRICPWSESRTACTGTSQSALSWSGTRNLCSWHASRMHILGHTALEEAEPPTRGTCVCIYIYIYAKCICVFCIKLLGRKPKYPCN